MSMFAVFLLDSVYRRKLRRKSRKKSSESQSRRLSDRVAISNQRSGASTHKKCTAERCRICLEDGSIAIYQQKHAKDILSHIKIITQIEINEDDVLPKTMCTDCYELLQSAIWFAELAQESDKILRSYELTEKPQKDSTEEDSVTKSDSDIKQVSPSWQDNDDDFPCNFPCAKCQLDFNTSEELSSHRRTTAHARPRIRCGDCGTSVCRGSLAAHVARRHTAAHAHICHVCAKTFAVKGALKRHLMIHTDSLPFSCVTCSYRCRYRASLLEHERTHSGDKPYACHTCPARFVSASNLRKHSRTHSDTPALQCSQCSRRFHTAHKLKAHVRVEHLGLREHVCQLCGKQFGYREKLGQHMKNVHKRPRQRPGRAPLHLIIDQRVQNKTTDVT